MGETGFKTSRCLTPPREPKRPANTEIDSVPEHCPSSEGTETLLNSATRVGRQTAENASVADHMSTRGIERAFLQLQDPIALSRTTAPSASYLPPIEASAILALAAPDLSSRDAEFVAALSGSAPSSQQDSCVQEQIPDPPRSLEAAPVSKLTLEPLQLQQLAAPSCIDKYSWVPLVASMVAYPATLPQRNHHHLARGRCFLLFGTPKTVPYPSNPGPVLKYLRPLRTDLPADPTAMPPDNSVPGSLDTTCREFFPAAQDPAPAPRDAEINSVGLPAEPPQNDAGAPAFISQVPTHEGAWAIPKSRNDVLAFARSCVFAPRYSGYPRDQLRILQALTQIGAVFAWGPAEQTAFTNLLRFRNSREVFPVCPFCTSPGAHPRCSPATVQSQDINSTGVPLEPPQYDAGTPAFISKDASPAQDWAIPTSPMDVWNFMRICMFTFRYSGYSREHMRTLQAKKCFQPQLPADPITVPLDNTVRRSLCEQDPAAQPCLAPVITNNGEAKAAPTVLYLPPGTCGVRPGNLPLVDSWATDSRFGRRPRGLSLKA